MDVREYIHNKNIQIRRERGDELIVNCPFCGDTEGKGSINRITGAYNCLHANSCGVRYSFWDFQKALGDEPKQLSGQDTFYAHKPPTYKKPQSTAKKPETQVVQYLKERGFSEETIKYFKIGQHNGATAMLPYFKNGELTNVKYRNIADKKMWTEKDAEPVLFNRDNITTNELIITEGEYDCMALHEYGIEAVSVPNGVNDFRWLENEWEWIGKFQTVYICFDSDTAGSKGSIELSQRLGEWRCRSVQFPKKDANDCLKNSIPKSEVVDCIAMAKDFTPDMLASPDDFTDDIIDSFNNPDRDKGTPTGLDNLDRILGGWRESELTIWSGRNSAGKSTLLNQVFLRLAESNIKGCIASFEMPVVRYLGWMARQYAGKAYPENWQVKEFTSWLSGKTYILNSLDSLTPAVILDTFEYASRRYGVKHFLIDSLMKVSFPGKEELKEHKLFINQLTSFAHKFKCHVHLVAHPRKGGRDSDRPGKVDIMGTGDITNLADNVLIMHRPDEEEKEAGIANQAIVPDAILYVKKNRVKGTEGSLKLKFDLSTKKFYE